MAKRQPKFKPATEFKTTKLPRNGPKDGMSTEAWFRGKAKSDAKWEKQREKNFKKLISG